MNKLSRKNCFFNAALLSMVAISHQANADEHTVAWYLANPPALNATYGACQNDPADFGKSVDCQNAKAAEEEKNAANGLTPAKNTGPKIVDPFADVDGGGATKP